jgi:uncharacterized protein (TIGR03086 family)
VRCQRRLLGSHSLLRQLREHRRKVWTRRLPHHALMIKVDRLYAPTYGKRMQTSLDLRPTHRIAVLASVDVVAAVTVDDLPRLTPCDGWNLADLLTHMTVQHHGFAAAARGQGADLAIWEPATVAGAVASDPAVTYSAAAADVIDAFAAADVPDAMFALPEFGPGVTVPGSVAIGFHFVDYVVHGWDVARTMDSPFELPAGVVAAALPVASAVPDGEFRTAPNALFRPAIQSTDQADDLDRILAYLGRSPEWTPPPRPDGTRRVRQRLDLGNP